MKALGIFITLLTLCLVTQPALAKRHKASYSPTPITGLGELTAEINQIVRQIDDKATIGVHIKSMKYGDTLYNYNSNRQLVPASILKIVTAQAALLYLGPEYKFQTSFITDGKVDNGVLQGDLYLVQSGDPTLTYYDLTDMMTSLKSLDIQQINGNVYIDNTAYDEVNYGPGWLADDVRYCYAAPINASIINHNCLSFRVAPSKTPGRLANIIESPSYFYSTIQNSVVTKSRGTRSCFIHLDDNTGSNLSVTGCLPKGGSVQGISTVIKNVMDYNKSLVRNLFSQSNIRVNGTISPGAAPADGSVIAAHQSKPLYTLINEMLKMSDNIIAGSIFKKIGALYTRQPGSWENGRSAITDILAKRAGINTWGMSVLDGSGLSRYNKISPEQLSQVLEFGFHHYATNYEFISALPISGVDGTLKQRMRNISWKVRAKTGTMSHTGVVALAGYAINRDKEPLAFVIIVNGRNGYGWKYKEMEDKIVTALTKYTRGN
jgi:D-alanyl-D-alanine carboxypeptidase/D-alanyl-D-alanine-endopeptidase (penicillin-binding protein 4)